MGAGSGRRRHLRTRLLLAMVGLAVAVLLVSALGAAAIFRRTAESTARHDVHARAPELATTLNRFLNRLPLTNAGGRRIAVAASRLLASAGIGVFVIGPAGNVVQSLAALSAEGAASDTFAIPNLQPRDLDLTALAAGQHVTGTSGGTVYEAVPLRSLRGRTPVVVVAEQVETRPLGRAGTFLLFTGLGALLVAAFVAAYLARRMTRRLAALEEASGRIAAGDLGARVEIGAAPADELTSLARGFNAMAAELEGSRALERAFLLSVSHDLRTPLTSIRGYATAIADGTVEGREPRIRAAQVIEREAQRLERLVADLLDLARLDAHQFTLVPHPLDARVVAEEVVEGFVPVAREWGVRLAVAPGAPAPADTDPGRLA